MDKAMVICCDAGWKEFSENATRKEEGIVLLGARMGAEMCFEQLQAAGIRIKFLVDSDVNRQGEKVWKSEYSVYAPDVLKGLEQDDIVLVTSEYYVQLLDMLKENDYKGNVYFYFFIKNEKNAFFTKEHLDYFLEKKDEVMSRMADDKSKEIFEQIYTKRLNKQIDYRDIMEGNQYFQESIIQTDAESVFVDGGAYDGDTIEKFIDFSDNTFKKIYGFEIDKINIDKFDEKKVSDDRIEIKQIGLWDKYEKCNFFSDDVGGRISESENTGNEVVCDRLDAIIDEKEKVTFIKMDIEGAEMKALEGASRILATDMPQLAICVYHTPNDIVDIPLLISRINPNYKFYIRHHDEAMVETVLYGVADCK